MKKTLMMLWMAVSLMVSLVGCSSEEMDYENPDVTVFVKQLKAGTYNMKNEKGVVEVPHFTEEDIPELLKYAEDLTIIPSFPSVYNTNNGKIRLGDRIDPSGNSPVVRLQDGTGECRKLRSHLFPDRRRSARRGSLLSSMVGRAEISEDDLDD